MSETYPRKSLCETLFVGHTPSSVGFGCKGTTKFADVQILFNFELRILNYEVENGRGKNNV